MSNYRWKTSSGYFSTIKLKGHFAYGVTIPIFGKKEHHTQIGTRYQILDYHFLENRELWKKEENNHPILSQFCQYLLHIYNLRWIIVRWVIFLFLDFWWKNTRIQSALPTEFMNSHTCTYTCTHTLSSFSSI